jgi:hypothetical protein
MDYPLRDHAEFLTYDGTHHGVAIKCPNCGRAYSAWFKQPIGPGTPQSRAETWDRTGDTLETLTLSPSFAAFDCYHSWIRDGQLCVDSTFKCNPTERR